MSTTKLTQAERMKLHRANKRKQLGEEEYKRQQAFKKRQYRMKKKQLLVNEAGEEVKSQDESTASFTYKDKQNMINNFLAEISSHLQKVDISLPDNQNQVIEYVKNNITQVQQSVINLKNCNNLAKQITENKIKDKGKKMLVSTTKNNLNFIGTIYNHLYNEQFDCSDFRFLETDFDRVIYYIESSESTVGGIKKKLSSIKAILRYLGGYQELYNRYTTEFERYKVLTDKKSKENLFNKEELEKYISWPDTQKLRADVLNNPKSTLREKLVMILYTTDAPRRVEFSQFMVLKKTGSLSSIKKLKDEANYLHLPSGNIVMNKYKTYTDYGQYTYKLNPEYVPLLKQLLKDTPNNTRLFSRQDGEFYKTSPNYIVDTFSKYSGKRTGVKILRHSYITWLKNTQPNMTLNKKEEYITKLGHNNEEFDKYYKVNV